MTEHKSTVPIYQRTGMKTTHNVLFWTLEVSCWSILDDGNLVAVHTQIVTSWHKVYFTERSLVTPEVKFFETQRISPRQISNNTVNLVIYCTAWEHTCHGSGRSHWNSFILCTSAYVRVKLGTLNYNQIEHNGAVALYFPIYLFTYVIIDIRQYYNISHKWPI